MNTPEKLAAFLTEHEITQREFAHEMSVSEGTVSRWLSEGIRENSRVEKAVLWKMDEITRRIRGEWLEGSGLDGELQAAWKKMSYEEKLELLKSANAIARKRK